MRNLGDTRRFTLLPTARLAATHHAGQAVAFQHEGFVKSM